MDILEITGILTAIATALAAGTSIFVIVNKKRTKRHILYIKLRTFYEWFCKSRMFCESIFKAGDQRSLAEVYNENFQYRPQPIKNISELTVIREKYAYCLKMEDENNVDEFAKLLASYIYTFDYMVSYFQKFAEDDKEMNMKKFKNLLGSSYPQIEKLEGVSPDEKISSYVFKFIEKIENKWKIVEKIF